MSFKLHILNASGSLSKFEKAIKKNFESGVKKIPKEYQKLKIDVVFYEDPYRTILEFGFGSYTPSSNQIFVPLDTHSKKLLRSLDWEFQRVLMHEVHHAMRWFGPGYGETLEKALISEGLADHFLMELFERQPLPWSVALRKNEIKKYLKIAKKEYGRPYYDHNIWFFGADEKLVPRWTGYALGFYIVGKYLEKHKDAKASKLYDIDAKKVLSRI